MHEFDRFAEKLSNIEHNERNCSTLKVKLKNFLTLTRKRSCIMINEYKKVYTLYLIVIYRKNENADPVTKFTQMRI